MNKIFLDENFKVTTENKAVFVRYVSDEKSYMTFVLDKNGKPKYQPKPKETDIKNEPST